MAGGSLSSISLAVNDIDMEKSIRQKAMMRLKRDAEKSGIII